MVFVDTRHPDDRVMVARKVNKSHRKPLSEQAGYKRGDEEYLQRPL
jgi:hypothetical protein